MRNISILTILFIFFSVNINADTTKKSKIRQVLYNGTADFAFFISESGWEVKDDDGNVLCSPYYVQITSNVPGRDKLLSVALAAKMAGSEVDFIGNCSSNPNYFNAHYIRLY